MTRHRFANIDLQLLLLVCVLLLHSTGRAAADEPKLLLLDRQRLAVAQQRIERKEPGTLASLRGLREEADRALSEGPYSVTDKTQVPPSGDKRDYMSVGPYWWPDPNKQGGLPYIRRDGQTNPERHHYDNARMGRMRSAVASLSLAWHFTGHEPYARHAARLLRTWFLDQETRMNPHLRYGQAIPGRTEGRYIGIIDTVGLIDLLDPALLLEGSPAWSEDDAAGLRDWFRQYATWLRESNFGRQESRHPNNHGTWHDAQVAAFCLFAGQREAAHAVLRQVGPRRIAKHIEPDGRQPHELARTKAFDYTVYNTRALVVLATLGQREGIDLWGYRTDDGRSILKTLDWLAPFATGEKKFPHKQIGGVNGRRAADLFRQAGLGAGQRKYVDIARQLAGDEPGSRQDLLHPWPEK